MTNDNSYGVMVLKFEGLIAIVLLLVGGFLMWQDHTFITPIIVLWTVMINFFYSRRAAETANNNIISAMQQAPAQIPQIPQIPQEPQIKITEQPAQANAPAYVQPTEEKANV